jgi:hypothetical protein
MLPRDLLMEHAFGRSLLDICGAVKRNARETTAYA